MTNKQDFIKDLKEAVSLFGENITAKEYFDWAYKNDKQVDLYNTFQTWSNAKKAIGIVDADNKFYFNKEQVAKLLNDAKSELGLDVLTQEQYIKWAKENNKPSLLVITRLFGKWTKVLEYSNFKISKRGKKSLDLSTEDCINVLKQAEQEVDGQLTFWKYNEWSKENKKISSSVIIKKFGSWSNAKKEANIKDTSYFSSDRTFMPKNHWDLD